MPSSRATLALLLLLLAVLGAAAGPAWAEEADSAVDQLTDAERAVLEARVPGWDALDAAHREKIARNVIRLRSLTPEERRRLERRIGALERHRQDHGRLPGSFGRLRERPGLRAEMRRRGLAVDALGAELWAALPDAQRAEVTEGLSERDRKAFERAFFHRVWTLSAETLATGEVPAVDLPADAPEGMAERFETLLARAREGNERARRVLAHLVLAQRVERATAGLDADAPPDPAALRALGAKLREADKAAFAAARDEAAEALATPEAREAYVARARGGWSGHGGRGAAGRGPPWGRGRGRGGTERRDGALRRLGEALEEAWPELERDPALRGPADALRRALERRR